MVKTPVTGVAARPYATSKRAATRDATRQRIVDATIELHRTVGDVGLTITEVARRAEVSRVTVYRHFPDQASLLSACTGHYFAQHAPPDPAAWSSIPDPLERLEVALRAVYGWFDETGEMVGRGEEDAPTNPVLAELLVPFGVAWDRMRDGIDAGWPSRSMVRRAMIGHALAFSTWKSLRRTQGLSADDAISSMVRSVAAVMSA